MKIAAIEPKTNRSHVFSAFKMPRLAMPLLGTILKAKGHDVVVFPEELTPIDESAVKEADLIMISTITPTAPRAYNLADHFRRMGKIVIMGGAHPSLLPEEALEHTDFVLRGEGDESIVELVEAIEKDGPYENIKGLSYKDNGKIIHNPNRDSAVNLDDLPIPNFTLIPNLKPEKLRIYPIMTSRGCPHNCVFCSVTLLFGRKYRFRSKELILEELKMLRKKQHVFFYDDNFAANRKRTKDLLDGMMKIGFKGSWSAQVRIDIYKDKELMELMKKSGCSLVYVGIESVNPETLKSYKKGITLKQIVEGVEVFHKYGIRVHGMFVIGADTDSFETIQATLDFAKKIRLDSVQFLILTPIPGSKLFSDWCKENRIFSTQWDLYDGHHVVYYPAMVNVESLQNETIRLHKEFYSIKEAIKSLLRGNVFSAYLRVIGKHIIKKWPSENRDYFNLLHQLVSKGNSFLKDTSVELQNTHFPIITSSDKVNTSKPVS